MTSRIQGFAKSLVALLCLFAWLEVSNHCVIAAATSVLSESSVPAATDSCCDSKDKKTTGEKSTEVCCRKLPTTEQVKLAVPVVPVVAVLENLLLLTAWIHNLSGIETAIEVVTGDPPLTHLVTLLDSGRCHPAFAPPLFS